ncbi:MAG: TadG family pilus assembly protein [Terracidiphilus sp.]|jgi:Flp pilus assembly protein TadG
MNRSGFPLVRRFVRRLLRSERGQSALVVVMTGATMIALSAASVEAGHIYYAYQQLVASTNAAALAGAQAMPNTTQAATLVTTYSAQTSGLNANPMLKNVTATPTFVCLSSVSSSLNVACQTSTGATGGYNALKVTQTATIPLWFGGLIGMKQMNVAATATAAMRGGQASPWNIAVILDTTGSMGSYDGSQCSGTREACAQRGLQMLLNDLYPCALGQTCSTTSPAPTPIDTVSLFVFPAVTTTTASKDYVCPTSNPTIVAYTFPDVRTPYTAGTAPASNFLLPSGDEYQILPFAINYKTSDAAASLNQAAPMVIAAGDSGVYNCPGVQTPGGMNTYYAQVIYTAQAALVTQQASYPNSKNAIILLSDGDATACASNAYTTGGACNTKANLVATEGTLNGTGTSTTNPSHYKDPNYPSALGECGQAVLAANYAASAGTMVYTIGYGSPTSGSCNSDKTYSTTVTTGGGTWAPGYQACQALAAMASAQVNFYSDDAGGCLATAPSNQAITKLTAIFHAIANNMSSPRLIPNSST